jgi:hypothetical protein
VSQREETRPERRLQKVTAIYQSCLIIAFNESVFHYITLHDTGELPNAGIDRRVRFDES